MHKCCVTTIQSVAPNQPIGNSNNLYSVGIHPWSVDPSTISQQLNIIASQLKEYTNIVAVGECGLDKNSQATIATQTVAFRGCINLSEQYKKPLIIHNVKCTQEILSLHKAIKPTQQWIIHGYRGNTQTAQSLIRVGIMLSIGKKFNPQLAESIPLDKLFIESDESELPIDNIYERVAATWGVTVYELKVVIYNNYKKLLKIEG